MKLTREDIENLILLTKHGSSTFRALNNISVKLSSLYKIKLYNRRCDDPTGDRKILFSFGMEEGFETPLWARESAQIGPYEIFEVTKKNNFEEIPFLFIFKKENCVETPRNANDKGIFNSGY